MTELLSQNITEQSIQLVFMGRHPLVINRPMGDSESPEVEKFETLLAMAFDCLDSGEWENFLNCIEPTVDISEWVDTNDFSFTNGTIAYKGYTLENGLTAHIVALCKEQSLSKPDKQTKREVKKLFKLLSKTMENTSNKVTQSLWDFLSRNNVPVMDNGNIIFYSTLDEEGLMNGLDTDDKGIIKRPRNMVSDTQTDRFMSLCAGVSNTSKNVGVFKVNPKNVVYVSNQTVSVCKMKQIDTITN
jgi:hypothetical protein